MKSFLTFIAETNWIYHGTTKQFDKPKTDSNQYMIDRAIGTHFATDPEMADRFSKGVYTHRNGPEPENGRVIKTKRPKDSELEVIKQKKFRHGSRQSDQAAIGAHIGGVVFSKPEHKELFKQWVMHSRHVDNDTAEAIHAHLMAGKSPSDKDRFGVAASKNTNFRDYTYNFDPNLGANQPFRNNIIKAFHDEMKKTGKKGLVYKNTSPMETKGIRSIKSIILFHPENHDYEDHK